MKFKILDLESEDFEKRFVESVTNTGFAVINNHGIDHEFIREIQDGWREFFLQPQEVKNLSINEKDRNFGYRGFKEETALGSKNADLKEYFHFAQGKDIPNKIRGNNLHLFFLLERLGSRLLEILDGDHGKLGADDACWNSDNTILRALYYPAMDFASEPGSIRAAAHEDINMITLLIAATSGGLQVKDLQGNWHDVPHQENSIIVNMGDMVQLMSGGKYKSTTHRVINPESSTFDRISIPFFIHPHSTTVLAPGITAKQFLQERLDAIHGKKAK